MGAIMPISTVLTALAGKGPDTAKLFDVLAEVAKTSLTMTTMPAKGRKPEVCPRVKAILCRSKETSGCFGSEADATSMIHWHSSCL